MPTNIRIKNQGNHCEIDPPHAHAVPGGTVVWTNDTGKHIWVFFPDHQTVFDNFPGDKSGCAYVRVGSGKKGKHTAKVNGHVPLAPDKTHRRPYTVYCEKTRSFALGGSDGEVDV